VTGLDQSGLNAYGFATGLPGASFVNGALAANPAVAAKFEGAGATVLGTVAQGAFNARDATGPHTYSSAIDITLDTTHLTGDLLVGLLCNTAFGIGFDSLSFTITVEGATVESAHFTTLSAAESFFDDNPLDLGRS
jgi:hypothetical protein